MQIFKRQSNDGTSTGNELKHDPVVPHGSALPNRNGRERIG